MKARLLNADADTFKVVCNEITYEQMHASLPWQFSQDKYSLGAYVQVIAFTDVLGREQMWWELIDVFAVCTSTGEGERQPYQSNKLSSVNAISLMPFMKSGKFINDEDIYTSISCEQIIKDHDQSSAVYETTEKLPVFVQKTLPFKGSIYALDIVYSLRRFQEGMYGHRFNFGYASSVKVGGVPLQDADIPQTTKEEILSIISIHDRPNSEDLMRYYIRLRTGDALYLSHEDFPDGWQLITGDPDAPTPVHVERSHRQPYTITSITA